MKQRLVRLPESVALAILDVLSERLAGGPDDLRDAFGCSKAEAARIEKRLEEAKERFAAAQEIESRDHVVCVFTRAEAANLHHVAGNGIGDDAADRLAVLGNSAAVGAGLRAIAKLQDARREAAGLLKRVQARKETARNV